MSPVPFGRRDRLTSAVGPDASGSNPGIRMRPHAQEIRDGFGAFALPERGRRKCCRKCECQREIPPLQIHHMTLRRTLSSESYTLSVCVWKVEGRSVIAELSQAQARPLVA